MRTFTTLCTLPLIVLLAACGSDEGGAPSAPVPPPSPAPPVAPAAAAEGAASTRVGTPVDRGAAQAARQGTETRERSRQVRTALRTARAASRGDRRAEALPHFERALTLAPSDERLLCETGYVAYRAGNLERATDLVGKALNRFGNPQQVAEAMRVPFAMCLYNAGRIAEDGAQTADAHGYYQTSLLLRENRVVRERFDATGGENTTAAARPPAMTLPALLGRLRASRCTDTDTSEENPYPCTVEVDRQVNASSADFHGAALIRVVTGDFNSETYLELAVQGRDGWHAAGTVLYVYNPGMNGITEEGEVGAMQFTSRMPGAPETLRFEVTHSRTDSDLGLDEAEFANDAATVVCGPVDGAIRCARLPREHEYVREAMGMGDDEDNDVDHAGLPIRERYAVALTFQPEAGTVTVRATEGELPVQLRRTEGTHPLRELLTSPDFALRVDW